LEEADPNIAVEEEIIPKPDIEFNAYPNPFNPCIQFEIKLTTEHTESTETCQPWMIQIFNIKGQKVENLAISNQQLAVSNEQLAISWNAEDCASGIYYCKLVNVGTGKVLSVKKVTLIK
ncbi:MAG: T9SS type A sorting domain-containing protein, partial [Candidatus Cloacimonetes bacterium]|nr:T9SS type A sorting domain-containing protein [Candidatus Cloacimonadota bacterium]